MTPTMVLGAYLVLLVAGGVMGWLKAGSKVSVISAVVSAVVLGVTEFVLKNQGRSTEIVLGLLLVMFAWRLAKTRKFMPSGLMLGLTAAALVLRLAL